MSRKHFLIIENDTDRDNFFFFAILVICFFKLFLVGTNEIVSNPYDSATYLRQSQIGIMDIGAAPQGYPFWLALSSIIGLSQRVAIEILYLFASFSVAFTFAKMAGRFSALILFGVLSFLPATFFLFDNALSDGFFACMTLMAIALSIGVLSEQASTKFSFWIRLLLLAFILGWMLITRNEDYLVVGWIFWLIGCRFVLQKQNRLLKYVLREAALCVTLLLLVTFSVGGVLSFYHFVTKGVFVRTISTLPTHMELLKNLASIDKGIPITRVPVTKAQREAAYLASPTLKRLKDYIENPENIWQLASSQAGIPSGEIGAGWIWHVFNNAAFRKESNTIQTLNEFWLTVNSELTKGFKSGNLKKKFVIHPLLAGNTSGLLTNFPQSLVNVFKGLFDSFRWQPDNEFESNLFDSGCLRRNSLVDFRGLSGTVQGWAFVDGAETLITKVEIGVYKAAESITYTRWFETEAMVRPDVLKGFSAEGRSLSEVNGFRIRLTRVRGDTVVARYLFSDGSYLVTPPLAVNKVTRIKHDSSVRSFEIFQGIDLVGKIMSATSHNNIRHKFQEWLAGVFAKFFPYILAIILIMAALIVVFSKKITGHDRKRDLYLAVAILIGGIFSQRILFYILIDAVGWDVQPRYLTSALVLLIVISAVLVTYSFRKIKVFFTVLP